MSPEQPTSEGQPKPVVQAARDSLLAFVDSILARPTAETVSPQAEVHPFAIIVLGKGEFAIPITVCREIVRVGEITRIPEAPPHVRGVLNLRGRVLPIVELRSCLGLANAPLTERSRVIMVEVQNRVFGLLVDDVSRIAKLAPSAMQTPAAEILSSCGSKVTAVTPMGAGTVCLLDLDRLLARGSDGP